MKVGIISEFNLNTANYGNQLQAYALNHFLRSACCVDQVESIALTGKQLGRHTAVFSLRFLRKAMRQLCKKKVSGSKQAAAGQFAGSLFAERLKQFERFRHEYIPVSAGKMDGRGLTESDYDAFVVGSDVVWSQFPLWISRTKFLDFQAKKPFRRISYAASFGRDVIPKENVRYIRKYLKKFDAVSVRENSSVSMLRSIGVENVSYCLDPTLLLSAQEWETLQMRPAEVEEDEAYVFVYLLGRGREQRERITAFAAEKGLKVVTVPHANGYYIDEDEDFGDVRLMDCSIENWIWLIRHAQYVVTDSFHGTVFSTIFHRRFLVLGRQGSVDINNRMRDYLHEINQTDKAIEAERLSQCGGMEWDYAQIDAAIELRRSRSMAFLIEALGRSSV